MSKYRKLILIFIQLCYDQNFSYNLSMGCVNSKPNEQGNQKKEELKAYIHHRRPQQQLPVESSPYPKETNERLHQNSNNMKIQNNVEKQEPFNSSLQNAPKNYLAQALNHIEPQILPKNSNIKKQPTSAIKADDIKINGIEGSGILNQDHKGPGSGIVEDLIVSNEVKKEDTVLIEQKIKEDQVEVQQSGKKQVQQFMKSIKQESQQTVRSEGGINFLPVVQGINFQIHIN